MVAVAQDGRALQYASETLKNDKDVVMVAVTQDGDALTYASETLKNDREVVMAAVTQNGHALYYASEELKNDKEVMMAAKQKTKKYDEPVTTKTTTATDSVQNAEHRKGNRATKSAKRRRAERERKARDKLEELPWIMSIQDIENISATNTLPLIGSSELIPNRFYYITFSPVLRVTVAVLVKYLKIEKGEIFFEHKYRPSKANQKTLSIRRISLVKTIHGPTLFPDGWGKEKANGVFSHSQDTEEE